METVNVYIFIVCSHLNGTESTFNCSYSHIHSIRTNWMFTVHSRTLWQDSNQEPSGSRTEQMCGKIELHWIRRDQLSCLTQGTESWSLRTEDNLGTVFTFERSGLLSVLLTDHLGHDEQLELTDPVPCGVWGGVVAVPHRSLLQETAAVTHAAEAPSSSSSRMFLLSVNERGCSCFCFRRLTQRPTHRGEQPLDRADIRFFRLDSHTVGACVCSAAAAASFCKQEGVWVGKLPGYRGNGLEAGFKDTVALLRLILLRLLLLHPGMSAFPSSRCIWKN